MHGKAKLMVYLLIAGILAAQAIALGIAPGQIDVDFKDTTQKMFVINNEHKDMKVLLYAQGELADYVELPQMLEIAASQETKQFDVKIRKPDLDKPGRHDIQIVAIEIPDEQSETIVARQAVVGVISIVVPYPGKFAEAELEIPKKAAGEPTDFVIKLTNHGTQQIDKAYARIEVYSPTNELLATLMTDQKAVEKDEMRELVARYNTPLNPGRYYARAVVSYDGQEIELEENFEVGNLIVEIKSIYVKEFRLGEIAKFDILIESKWNEILPDVFADMIIKDKYGKEISKFKTRETDLSPHTLEILDAYWDTAEVTEGSYNAKITLHFIGNNLEKSVNLDVREDAIDIDLMPTAQAISQEGETSQTSFIIILIVVSMIINIGLFIIFARRKK